MPPHYSRVGELLKTPDNIIIDVKPMQNALTERRKAQEFDINKDMQDRQLGMQQQGLDMQRERFDLDKQRIAQEEADKKIKMVAGMASVIDEEKDPALRAAGWGRLRSMHPEFDGILTKHGIDPNDHSKGPRMLMAQYGLYDPEKRRLADSRVELERAHGDYYRGAADAVRDKAGAARTDAQTRAYRAAADYFRERDPTEAEWTSLSQPGGLFHQAGFTGAVPYANRGAVLAAGKRSRETEEKTVRDALVESGLDESQIAAVMRSNRLEKALGPPKRGHVWEIDSRTGRPTQTLVAEKGDAKQDKIDRSAPIFMKNLDIAATVLGKTSWPGRVLGETTLGGYVNPETKEALELTDHAIAQLTAMVNGQRHANAQDVRYIQYFRPKATDSNEIMKFKLDQAKKFFGAYLSAKASGEFSQQTSEVFSSQVQQAYEELVRKQTGKATVPRGEDGPRPEGGPRFKPGGREGWRAREIPSE